VGNERSLPSVLHLVRVSSVASATIQLGVVRRNAGRPSGDSSGVLEGDDVPLDQLYHGDLAGVNRRYLPCFVRVVAGLARALVLPLVWTPAVVQELRGVIGLDMH
jgi:hypothetical protein